MTLLLLLFHQDDAATLVEKLRSDTVDVRDEAAQRLKELGAPALPALDTVANDKDPEVAARATHIARVIRTQQLLTPNLIRRMPGVEERLAKGDAHEWTLVLLKADAYRNQPEGIEKADLEALVVRAFQGAKTLDEQKDLCWTVKTHKLSAASSEVCRLFDIRERNGERASRHSPVRDLHARALEALGELEDHQAAPKIVELLTRGDADTASGAAGLLVKWKSKKVLPRIVSMIDEEQIAPALALSILEGFGAREAVSQVLRLLKDETAGDDAAELLAEWQARDVAPELIKLLRHRDHGVRGRAMALLAEFRCQEAVPTLLQQLRTEPATRLRGVVETLGILKVSESGPDLLELLKERDPWNPRRSTECLEALSRIGERKAIPIAMEWLASGSDQGLWVPAQVLADLKAVEAVPDLLKLLEDPSSNRRAAGLLGLSKVADVGSIPSMAARLVDPDKYVRIAALRALSEIDAQTEIPKIEALLRDENKWVRNAAVGSLRTLRARESTGALIRSLADAEFEVARNAATSLGRIGASEAIPDLIKLIGHPDAGMRLNAAGALTRLGSREGITVMLKADPAKEYLDLKGMNAVRQPELWKKLREKRLSRDLEGTNREVWDQLSREAGLPIEVKRSLGFSKVSCDRGRRTVLEAIEELQWSHSILLEPDRILMEGGGHGYWKHWWAEEQKKK